MSIRWRFSKAAQAMKASDIREILKLTQHPEVISFAGGLPSPHSFPLKLIKKMALKVLREEGPKALQYGITEGLPELREALAERMKKYGVECDADNVLITEGAMQGIDLVTKVLADPHDSVVVESPAYLGALQTFMSYLCSHITVKMDKNGMIVPELEHKLSKARTMPKFIYTVPDFQNPTGVTMSHERRHELVKLAEKHNIPILEDQPYYELRYKGKDIPPIKSIGGDSVIYLGTFSKILAPGFRIGWVVADKELINKLAIAKQGTDLCGSPFLQYIALDYLKTGAVDKQIAKIRRMYKRRRSTMLKALAAHMPKGVRWTKPDGGLFIWLTLPRGIDTKELFPLLIEKKVAYVPGHSFFADDSGPNTARLNFSNADDDKIEEGIKRLADVVKARMPSKPASK